MPAIVHLAVAAYFRLFVVVGRRHLWFQRPFASYASFWNIKQLASTPADALAIPVRSGKKNVNCAAFGNMVRGEYAVHMVNNGAECEAVISGIPAEVKELKVYVTNTKDCMKETAVKVENGRYGYTCRPSVSLPYCLINNFNI